jgi:hypothetical protein
MRLHNCCIVAFWQRPPGQLRSGQLHKVSNAPESRSLKKKIVYLAVLGKPRMEISTEAYSRLREEDNHDYDAK